MKRMTIALIGISLIITGCATPPIQKEIKNSRTYSIPYDEAWEHIVDYFAKNNIQIKNISKDSGLISAERSRFNSQLADCGKSGVDRPVSNRVSLNVFVKKTANANNPTVSVNTDFLESRISGWDGRPIVVECFSTGELERAILDSI